MARRAKLRLGLTTVLLLGPGCIEEDPNFVFATESGTSSSGGPVTSSTGPDGTTTGSTSVGTGDGDSDTGLDSTGGCIEELCNGVDDDCDDEIDEGCDCIDGETEACFSGDPGLEGVGECAAGSRECTDGQWGACENEVLPAAEECNSLDDDCDDEVDEDFGQVNCGMGICMVTVDVCLDGTPQDCIPGDPLPAEECNGFDDDCNGMVDDIMCDCLNGEMQDCYTGPMGTEGVGICAMGTQLCVDGQWDECTGDQTPLPEACNDADDDCNGMVDDGDPGGGGACGTGLPGLCAQGTQACVGGAIQCEQTVFPAMEICDGFDNDCDTGIDEGNPEGGQACSAGLQGVCDNGTTLCQGGALTCSQTVFPSPELCNGLNDDCDGSTDEGNPESGQTCSTGLLGACDVGATNCSVGVLDCTQVVFPGVEDCNGVDDDCDGVIDDGAVGGGLPCPTGLDGVCGTGISDCTGGMAACNQTVFPSPEVCNGLDDDCNGTPDDGNPGGGAACPTGQPGVCTDGTELCTGGAIVCEPDIPASAETCNGLDDDCNGATDDGDPGGGGICSTGQPGVCDAGTEQCSGGAIVCNQNVMASAEACNGSDDDCDGMVDDGDPGGGANCSTGLPGACNPGTTACTAGAIVCNQDVMAAAETCNGIDDDCDGATDEGNPGGGANCNSGQQGVCAAGTTACSGGGIVCNANVSPSPELCDGLDNDCDGVADDGNPGGGGNCNTGLPGICGPGTTACSGGGIICNQNVMPAAEACNGIDDDCDGMVDEGNPGGGAACNTGLLGVCAAGSTDCSGGGIACTQTVMPGVEICNGLDDDCDGMVDEGNPDGGAACNTGQPGVCAAGTEVCSGGALVCNQDVMAGAELCDGLDNDCDAVVDDGNPGGGANCNTGLPGVCDPGTTACSGGAIVCNQDVMAGVESCNGLDDDCDGMTDDGNPGGGAVCATGQPGVCSPGTTSCSGGALVCNPDVMAGAEVCNGLDDDCDAIVDDGNPGGGMACSTGQPGVCDAGTTACSGGAVVCNQNIMAGAEACDGLDNDCDGLSDEGDPGGGVACSTGLPGVCDPGTTSCSGGAQVCIEDMGPSTEVCDGLDNDCDGLVDDGNPGSGMACNTGLPGACAAGTTSCSGGATVCNQDVAAMPEICGNAVDDDCNGVVDDGCGFGSDSGYTGYDYQGLPLPCDDILATGTPTGLTDDSQLVVPIGFTFPMYGANFTNVTIQSNGALHFDTNTYMTLGNVCLPTATAPSASNVYVFWDDLNPSSGMSEVYYETLGPVGDRRFVVQWETAHFGGSVVDLIRVQAMLNEATGVIDVCYVDTLSAGDIGDNGAEATSGIQQSSVDGFQYSCNTPDLLDGLWLQYVPF